MSLHSSTVGAPLARPEPTPSSGAGAAAGAPPTERSHGVPAVGRSSEFAAFARYRALIDDWSAFCSALERPLAPVIRANTARIGRDQLASLLAGEGYAARALPWHPDALELDTGFRPGRHWGMLAGLFQVQEAASMVPVELLDVRPGHRVLDLCAAPGNKTTQIADALAGTGTLVANDANPQRLGALNQTLKRHGVFQSVRTRVDGQSYPESAGRWDRVLVDAPCSCEGTYRKTASAAEVTPDRFRAQLVERQTRLLLRALEIVRPGGRVVYSTCTFAPEENEGVVAAALTRAGGAYRLYPARVNRLAAAPGLTEWQGQRWGDEMTRCARLWPHHNDTGGFFAAVIERAPDDRDGRPGHRRREEASDGLRETPEARGHLLQVRDQFGIPDAPLDGLRAVPERRKYIQAVAADLAPPPASTRQQVGIPAVGVQSRPPKPTTAIAMALGRHATRRVIDVDATEASAYLQRRAFVLDPERRARVDPQCHVLVRYQGWVLGVGVFKRGRLVSLFPKGWVTGVPMVPGAQDL